jgi:hypothetical protein
MDLGTRWANRMVALDTMELFGQDDRLIAISAAYELCEVSGVPASFDADDLYRWAQETSGWRPDAMLWTGDPSTERCGLLHLTRATYRRYRPYGTDPDGILCPIDNLAAGLAMKCGWSR